jgi:hypothetical protein
MKDRFLAESFDPRQRPRWVSRYLSLSLVLGKIQKIREISFKLTSKGLRYLIPYSTDPDWKVRLEVVKALRKVLSEGDVHDREKAISFLKVLDLDPNPVVEIWVSRIYHDFTQDLTK